MNIPLIQLSDKEINEIISKKNIYIFEKNVEYLQDLKGMYPTLFEKVRCVIEPNCRYQGNVLGIETCNSNILEQINWTYSALIISSDYYKEAYLKLINEHENLPTKIYYFLNIESEVEMKYAEKYRYSDLTNTIVFRSGPHSSSYVPGTDFADNARAVFEYMLAHGYNQKYRLVWLVKNPSEFSTIKRKNDNVDFLAYDWNKSLDESEQEKYYGVLFTAKYVLFTDAYGFARNCRKDQIRIQLWHGCGFKTRTNFVPCENRYEYNIVISPLYKKIHQQIYGLRDDQVVITGYPKADWLFHPVEKEKLALLKIPRVERYLFWLPPFRQAKSQMPELNEKNACSETGLPILESFIQMQKLNDILSESGMVIVIKLHPFQDENQINTVGFSNIVVIRHEDLFVADIQINQLLAYADALISDYSSVAVEFMNLNRPMAFTLDDVEEYQQSRGFVFEDIQNYLPGKEIYNVEDFMIFVNEIIEKKDCTKEKRQKLINEMHTFHDDKSSERFVKWMLALTE